MKSEALSELEKLMKEQPPGIQRLPAPQGTTQVMVLDEPKKHSVRYNAAPEDPTPMLTSVYVSKRNLPQPWPKRIQITIEPQE